MKIIEEPSFQMEDSKGFDKLVEREMETLEGGEGDCTIRVGCIVKIGDKTTTTSTSSGNITSTTGAVNPTALTIM